MIIDNYNKQPTPKATSATGYAMRLWKQSSCGMWSDCGCMNKHNCNIGCGANQCCPRVCNPQCGNLRSPVITAPMEGQTTDIRPVITGTAQHGSTVNICLSTRGCTEVAVDTNGHFSLQLPFDLDFGTYTITATAQIAGTNRSSEPTTRTFEVIPSTLRNPAGMMPRGMQQLSAARPTNMANASGIPPYQSPPLLSSGMSSIGYHTGQQPRSNRNENLQSGIVSPMQQRSQMAMSRNTMSIPGVMNQSVQPYNKMNDRPMAELQSTHQRMPAQNQQMHSQNPSGMRNNSAAAQQINRNARNSNSEKITIRQSESKRQMAMNRVQTNNIQTPNPIQQYNSSHALKAKQQLCPGECQPTEFMMTPLPELDEMQNHQDMGYTTTEKQQLCPGECQPTEFMMTPLAELDELPKQHDNGCEGIENDQRYYQVAHEKAFAVNAALDNFDTTITDSCKHLDDIEVPLANLSEKEDEYDMDCEEEGPMPTHRHLYGGKPAMYQPDDR